ncbi:MAG: type II toxin-antitoxin system PemK/MazF family toxin [Rivularia sp. T60_A2020_040]|nr:type II toxin-antitoxin system PemK/MazF family toxin [Rivularia sp. T60_A2020_040]
MPNYSKNSVILVRYPFSDLSAIKVRPAVVVNSESSSQDYLIVPLTSRIDSLFPGEFILTDWEAAQLNVPTAVKRGIYTIEQSLIIKFIGKLSAQDAQTIDTSLRLWLAL